MNSAGGGKDYPPCASLVNRVTKRTCHRESGVRVCFIVQPADAINGTAVAAFNLGTAAFDMLTSSDQFGVCINGWVYRFVRFVARRHKDDAQQTKRTIDYHFFHC